MTAAFTGSKEADEGVMSGQALKRIGQADDIADVVAFLPDLGRAGSPGRRLKSRAARRLRFDLRR